MEETAAGTILKTLTESKIELAEIVDEEEENLKSENPCP